MSETTLETKLKCLLLFSLFMANRENNNRDVWDRYDRRVYKTPPTWNALLSKNVVITKGDMRNFTPLQLMYSLLYSLRNTSYQKNAMHETEMAKLIPKIYVDRSLKNVVGDKPYLFFRLLPVNFLKLLIEVYQEIIYNWIERLNNCSRNQLYFIGLENQGKREKFISDLEKVRDNAVKEFDKIFSSFETKKPLSPEAKRDLEQTVRWIENSRRFSDRFKKMVKNKYNLIVF